MGGASQDGSGQMELLHSYLQSHSDSASNVPLKFQERACGYTLIGQARTSGLALLNYTQSNLCIQIILDHHMAWWESLHAWNTFGGALCKEKTILVFVSHQWHLAEILQSLPTLQIYRQLAFSGCFQYIYKLLNVQHSDDFLSPVNTDPFYVLRG